MQLYFCPKTWHGIPEDFQHHEVYPWVADLPSSKKIYCVFWANWDDRFNLPPGYDHYLISYHRENINLPWLHKQRQQVHGKFVVLHPGNHYDYQLPNTEFVTHITWHRDCALLIDWWGVQPTLEKKQYKYSAVCNRMSQGKLWIITKLLETARDQSLLVLNQWIEPKNVHNWKLTNNAELDLLTTTFLEKYKGLELKDGFDQRDNSQRHNSNPWQPLYTDTALHFVAGSFHYSYMAAEDHSPYIYPGPDIDEKTLKCLVAGTPFVPAAQFDIYGTLTQLGLKFDYGFDTSWDQDTGNISRFQSICRLIDYLNQYSIDDIVDMTQESTKYNQEFIISGDFYRVCEDKNIQAINNIFQSMGE
jgi:hypothetical protein